MFCRITLVAGGLLLSGCNLMGPNFHNPGPASYQQSRAVVYDPYPDPDIGPEVEGSRPPAYEEPRNETREVQESIGARARAAGIYLP